MLNDLLFTFFPTTPPPPQPAHVIVADKNSDVYPVERAGCCPADYYDIGSATELTAAFTDIAGDAVNPTVVVLRIKDPSGTVTTYTPAIQEFGSYFQNIVLSQPGYWYYRFEATGNYIAAGDGTIFVRNSPTLS